jgi:drug/metabolite transporter (DMT)-like permease
MNRNTAIGFLIAASILWSTSGLLIKSIDWNPIAICGMRGLIASITLYFLARPFEWSRSKDQWIAAIAYASTVLTFILANKLTTSANAIFLQYTAPIYVALFGGKMLGEKSSRFDWMTIGIAIGGMFLFFFDKLSTKNLIGNWVAIISGIAYAWQTLSIKKQKTGSPQSTIILGNMLAFLVSIPFMVSVGFPNSKSWFYLIVLGVVQLGLGTYFYSKAVRNVRGLELIMIPFIEPILNPIWVMFFVGEHPGPMATLGGAIILFSVILRSVWPVIQKRRLAI